MALQKKMALSHTDIDCLAIARFGQSNKKLSNHKELRFGNRGSVSVKRDEGLWYNHEKGEGGRLEEPPRSASQTTSNSSKSSIAAQYDYRDATGALIFEVCRLKPKDFRQRRPDGEGGWVWNVKGITQVPYRLPKILAAPDDETIFIVEGEKDCDNLSSIGLTATCNAGGAMKWSREFGTYLQGRPVVILPDADEAGENHAHDVAKKLEGFASAIRILRLPDLTPKGDVSDWLAAGGTADKLRALADAAPLWDHGAANTDTDTDTDTRLTFFATRGNLSALTDDAEQALIKANAEIFQRAGVLVRPGFSESDASDGSKIVTACLHEIDAWAISDELSKRTTWKKATGKDAGASIDPPHNVCATLLSRHGRWHFPHVSGILTCPTLRQDGSICSTAGYDSQSRFYLALEHDFSLPPIPEYPTRENAVQALDILKELLIEFPFITGADRSVALSLVLSAICRGTLGVVPVHAFTAPTPGSGKSFLVDVASAIISGRPAPVIAAGSDATELEKRLAAKLLSGAFLISIDNLNGYLGGDFLCQLAERPLVSVRVLGKSETPQIEFRGVLTANGNNLSIMDDMTRRALLARLDPQAERPEDRQFVHSPIDIILANRGKYVAAALTVVRAYLAAGLPDKLPSLASYGLWSDRIRSALVWLDATDPVQTMFAARESDPVTAGLRALLLAWREALYNESLTCAAIIARLQMFDPAAPNGEALIALRQAVETVAALRGSLDANNLGYYLRRHRGRPIDGLRLAGDPDRKNVMQWRVEKAVP